MMIVHEGKLPSISFKTKMYIYFFKIPFVIIVL